MLEQQKANIRRDLAQPAIQAYLANSIEILKKVYTPDNEYYEAFHEVIKEMGY